MHQGSVLSKVLFAAEVDVDTSEVWYMKGRKMGILPGTERSIVRATCGVQLKDRKIVKNMMVWLGLNEAMDQLSVANNVCWHCHVLRREDGHVLGTASEFGIECDGKRERG